MSNIVYIATSIDGYISDRNDNLDWLEMIPNPDGEIFGWAEFMSRIDAIVMGRKTFEKVCSFDCDWPYTKPVFVLSSTLKSLPEAYQGKVEVVEGPLTSILKRINEKGYRHLYIDGGVVIQSFLKEDLIDEMIITTIPVLLGGGTPLFSNLPQDMEFEFVRSEVLLNALVQTHYLRKRE